MSGFSATYELTRARMVQAIDGLSDEQLRWRPHKDALSVFEMLMHVAGGDTFFFLRLQEREGDDFEKRLERCARDKVINDEPFPFSDDEASMGLLVRALDHTYAILGPMLREPEEWLDKEIETPLGPVDGASGIFARIAQHPAYHTGQVWLYRFDPRFPG
ncbi:MAG: DinB family protein [Armatimonadetes bacterium]|nr:DinB family protein [Armatimonadota bacterium]